MDFFKLIFKIFYINVVFFFQPHNFITIKKLQWLL